MVLMTHSQYLRSQEYQEATEQQRLAVRGAVSTGAIRCNSRVDIAMGIAVWVSSVAVGWLLEFAFHQHVNSLGPMATGILWVIVFYHLYRIPYHKHRYLKELQDTGVKQGREPDVGSSGQRRGPDDNESHT